MRDLSCRDGISSRGDEVRGCLTCETGLADTLVVVRQLDTVETVGWSAGVRETFVYVTLASLASESRRTVAAISAHSVHASAVVETLRRDAAESQGWSAVVCVDLTEDT